MDDNKIAEMFLKLEMDDLKDASMLADYAKKLHEAGESTMASYMSNRAMSRLSHVDEAKQHIHNVMARSGVSMSQNMYEEILEQYVREETERIKHCLETM